jgi:hypothetical protein
MARRFFYVSLGILALALAYQLGARQSEAQAFGSGPIAFVSASDPQYIWDSSDQCWRREGPAGTEYSFWAYSFDMPFPPSSVIDHVHWNSRDLFVTDAGVVWEFTPGGAIWTVVGTFGGGPVTVEDESWGAIKEMFMDK